MSSTPLSILKQSAPGDLPLAGDPSGSYATLVGKVRRLTLVSNASAAMLMRDDPRDILTEVYELLRVELQLDCCFNYLVDDEATRLRLNFAAGVSAEQEDSLEWLDFGQAVCGNVALQRAEIVREDVQSVDDPMVALSVRSGLPPTFASH